MIFLMYCCVVVLLFFFVFVVCGSVLVYDVGGVELYYMLMQQVLFDVLGKYVLMLMVIYLFGGMFEVYLYLGLIFVYVFDGVVVLQLEGQLVCIYYQGESWYEIL